MAGIVINLKLYQRSYLLIAVGLYWTFTTLLSLIPLLFAKSTSVQLRTFRTTVSSSQSLAFLLVAALGLLTVSYPLRNRSAKMALTKPCPLEMWQGANFLSPFLVALFLYGGILFFGLGCSFLWGLKVQSGLVYVTLDQLCRAVIVSSYLLLLTTLFHPVIAFTIAFLFHESIFYYYQYFLTWLASLSNDASSHPLLSLIQRVFGTIYMTLPCYEPYKHKTDSIYSTLEVSLRDGVIFAYTLVYALVFALFCYTLSLYFLKKKRLT